MQMIPTKKRKDDVVIALQSTVSSLQNSRFSSFIISFAHVLPTAYWFELCLSRIDRPEASFILAAVLLLRFRRRY